MPFVPKVPESCRNLDLARVSRALEKHYGDIYASARVLKVSAPDLRRLIWSKPKLLDAAHELMECVVLRAQSELISALFDPDSSERRREWAAGWILSSRLGQDSPFAPARRGVEVTVNNAGPPVPVAVRWADGTHIATMMVSSGTRIPPPLEIEHDPAEVAKSKDGSE
jgi:hypothetical protein